MPVGHRCVVSGTARSSFYGPHYVQQILVARHLVIADVFGAHLVEELFGARASLFAIMPSSSRTTACETGCEKPVAASGSKFCSCNCRISLLRSDSSSLATDELQARVTPVNSSLATDELQPEDLLPPSQVRQPQMFEIDCRDVSIDGEVKRQLMRVDHLCQLRAGSAVSSV